MSKIKKGLALLLFVFTLNVYAQEDNLKWLTNFEEAKQLSKDNSKPILMYFTGSDWCSPCKKLKADFFNSEKFIQQSKEFVLLLVDLPRRNDLISAEQKRRNMLLMQDYNKRGSFPTLVGLNAEGKVLGDINGYGRNYGTDDHFAFLKKILKKY